LIAADSSEDVTVKSVAADASTNGKAAAWAHRLCVDHPTTTNKQGKTIVRYPRGAEAEKWLHAEAADALKPSQTPENALAVVLRLLAA
jgi:hypothetical protein